MSIYAYDIECFKNFFSVIFVRVVDEKEVHTFYISDNNDDRAKLKNFLSREIGLVGYNNHSYDDPMLRYVLSYSGNKILKDTYRISNMLISDIHDFDEEIKRLKYPKEYYPWKTIDLMLILGFNKLGISLKQAAINLKWHKIQDLPFSPSKQIREEEIEKVLSYNLNDVLITKRLYEEIEPIRILRNELSKIYHVNLTSASDSKIANLILENVYSNELKKDISIIKRKRTPRDKILLGDCIAPFIKFGDRHLKELQKRISSIYVYAENKFRYTETLYYADCEFSLGIGGLHSKDAPGKFFTNNDVIIQDADVSSYYPNLIINNNFYPEHLGDDFIKVLKRITNERIEAKKAGDKIKADGLKITINSIFGKLGFEYFWLYDPKQFISTTINGQLGLLMLIEGFHRSGIKVISANTDGVICEIPRGLEDKYYDIARRWQEHTGLELEFTPYKKYIRRDVNSYITEKMSGETKEKGVFVREIELNKGYRMPVVPKAIHNYFINNIPIRETLENTKDIMEFCISQKVGYKFDVELHTNNGIELQQKTNRFYITNSGGKLFKRDRTDPNRLIGLYVDNMVNILNNYNRDAPFETYDVDLNFYEKEAMKIIDEIEPPQMSFDFLR